jgi:hypothetical protein
MLVLLIQLHETPAVWMPPPPRIGGGHGRHESRFGKSHQNLAPLADDSSFIGSNINETEIAVLLKNVLDSFGVAETQAELKRLQALHNTIQSDSSFDEAWLMTTPGMVSVFKAAKLSARMAYDSTLAADNTTKFAAVQAAAQESAMEVLGGTWPTSKLMMAAALAARAAAEATKDAKGGTGDQLYAACEAAAELMVRRDQGWAMAAETAAKAAVKAGGTGHDARMFAAEIAARYSRSDKGATIYSTGARATGMVGVVGDTPLDKAKAVAAAFDISLAAGEEKREALEMAAHAAGLATRKEAKKMLLLERNVSGVLQCCSIRISFRSFYHLSSIDAFYNTRYSLLATHYGS